FLSDRLRSLPEPPLFLIQPCVVDEDRGPVGESAEQVPVLWCELPTRERIDPRDADNPALRPQRQTKDRLNVFIPEIEIRALGPGIAAVEDQPLLRLYDASGEPFFEPPAETLPFLRIESDRLRDLQ